MSTNSQSKTVALASVEPDELIQVRAKLAELEEIEADIQRLPEEHEAEIQKINSICTRENRNNPAKLQEMHAIKNRADVIKIQLEGAVRAREDCERELYGLIDPARTAVARLISDERDRVYSKAEDFFGRFIKVNGMARQAATYCEDVIVISHLWSRTTLMPGYAPKGAAKHLVEKYAAFRKFLEKPLQIDDL